MKNVIPICIVILLLCTTFGAAGLPNNENTKEENKQVTRDFTHTIFGEFGTATWCGYCKYAHAALKEIYAEGQYPFFYVSLVTDKNTVAYQRCDSDYNAYGWPTLWFDGGYKINVGAGSTSSAKAAYIASINSCGSRAVEDVDIEISAFWVGGTTIEIDAAVTNKEAVTYGGHIRVYITEIVSTMGWIDTGGFPYTYAFLDYAFNQPLSIPAGNSWSNTMQWDGASHGYPGITENNIMIIGAVFNDEWHQGYSYPPSSNPFNAYYVDDAVGVPIGAPGPYNPKNPSPAQGATNVDVNIDLSWTGGGSQGSTITYDVYFGPTSTPQKVSANQSTTTYDPGTLGFNTTYYWKIISWDQDQNSAHGPLWQFTTTINPNTAPEKPTISGPTSGKPGSLYKYTITATDPDGDPVYGYIIWSDNTITDWVGPYNSGEAFFVTHAWSEKGTYTVQVKVKDVSGAESQWATLDVKMPSNVGNIHPFLQWFITQFPHAFPILRYFLEV